MGRVIPSAFPAKSMSLQTDFPVRAAVGVLPAAALFERKPLLELLEQMFPVRFEAGLNHECVARLDLGSIGGSEFSVLDSRLPVFWLRPARGNAGITPRAIKFSGRPPGQPYLEGCVFDLGAKLSFAEVRSAPGEEVVLEADGQALWVETTNQSGARVTVAGGLPDLPGNTPAGLRLIENRWLQLVPLLDFLVTVTAPFDWERRPPRACLMFDDPNLHWRTFGFIDFQQLARHASEHNYHASMAMVPLDTWYTNDGAARIFRDHHHQLSLLIHGTYRTHAELICAMPAARRLALLTEGIRRIQRFEQRSGIMVSRVMAPPHHACSVEACVLMSNTGYDAACVSWNALVRHNQGVAWQSQFGLRPAELLAQGFPVVPRFNFGGREDSRVFLAALLRQPIIMLGHHWDLAEGLAPLAQAAGTVNRLGHVEWSDMAAILRASWLGRRAGRTYQVRLYSRAVDIPVPENVDTVIIERPWLADDSIAPLEVQGDSIPAGTVEGSGKSVAIQAVAGSVMRVRSPGPGSLTAGSMLSPRARLVAYARRLACESRDRAMPYFKSLRRG